MKDCIMTVAENLPLTKDVYRMVLAGDVSDFTAPGQFLNLRLEGQFLRRPISVCDLGEDRAVIIYKAVGKGTARLAAMEPGEKLSVLTGLGNGYDLACAGEKPLLIGGGVGVPPLYLLAKRLRAQGKAVQAVLGFNRASEIFYEAEFRALGCAVTVATADGSCGVRGFVTDALPEDYSYYYCCGPEPMLRAVYRTAKGSGQLSFEKRMGCGFGACMGCSCKTITGYKRICREGPVLRKEEILWED
jgi:dihydroorotate dehydrogenase electron transfer subunit